MELIRGKSLLEEKQENDNEGGRKKRKMGKQNEKGNDGEVE